MSKYEYTTGPTERFLPEEVGDYLIHRTRVAIVPRGEPIFWKTTTEIEVVDTAGGEMVLVGQFRDNVRGVVSIERAEWPVIRLVLDAMVARCRVEREDTDGAHD